MPKIKAKRCIRPQCSTIYLSDFYSDICFCGADITDCEVEDSIIFTKNTIDKTFPKKEVPKKGKVENRNKQDKADNLGHKEHGENSPIQNITKTKKKGYLILLLDDDKEISFELSNRMVIGRASENGHVDIDLYPYAGKSVSKEHAIIQKEKGQYYLINRSQNHSLRIIKEDESEIVMEYSQKELLTSGDGIIFSQKILLEFKEEE